MDLTPYVAQVREQLLTAAEAGGEEGRALAERLAASLESATRLALLEALSAAAADITAELAPASVEVRLRGRDPELVVTAPTTPSAHEPDEPVIVDEGPLARINLRLPQDLKDRVDDAARGAGVSVNTWLVRAAAASLARATSTGRGPSTPGGTRYSGWVR